MEEDDKKPKKALEKFVYNPEAIDNIASFNLNIDHLHWTLFCKLAYDLTTTPEFLMGSILERFLVQLNLLDPKAPSNAPFTVAVTLQDIRDNPKGSFNIKPNKVLGEETVEEDQPSGLKSFFEDDDGLDL